MAEVLDRETLKALSTETRQEIIKMLSRRPYTASEISKILNKHVTTITEHLNTLEKSGLIKKKKTENKWVYYALSDKGERLFKPKFYSWIIVLSISVICLVVGGYQIFSESYFAAPMAERAAIDTTGELGKVATVSQADYTGLITGIILIAVAMIGFVYLICKRKKFSVKVSSISL